LVGTDSILKKKYIYIHVWPVSSNVLSKQGIMKLLLEMCACFLVELRYYGGGKKKALKTFRMLLLY